MHDIKVYGFNVGDVEDPELYAAAPIIDFEKTEKYQWLKHHAVKVYLTQTVSRFDMGYDYEIRAVLSEQNYIIYKLKYE